MKYNWLNSQCVLLMRCPSRDGAVNRKGALQFHSVVDGHQINDIRRNVTECLWLLGMGLKFMVRTFVGALLNLFPNTIVINVALENTRNLTPIKCLFALPHHFIHGRCPLNIE